MQARLGFAVMSRPIPRLSYVNVVATLALFIALGGASYAAVELPANSVGVRQIAFPVGGQTATEAGGRLTVTGLQRQHSVPRTDSDELGDGDRPLERLRRIC